MLRALDESCSVAEWSPLKDSSAGSSARRTAKADRLKAKKSRKKNIPTQQHDVNILRVWAVYQRGIIFIVCSALLYFNLCETPLDYSGNVAKTSCSCWGWPNFVSSPSRGSEIEKRWMY